MGITMQPDTTASGARRSRRRIDVFIAFLSRSQKPALVSTERLAITFDFHGVFLKPLQQVEMDLFCGILADERQIKELANSGAADHMVYQPLVKPLAENISKGVRDAKVKISVLLINGAATRLSPLFQAAPLLLDMLGNETCRGYLAAPAEVRLPGSPPGRVRGRDEVIASVGRLSRVHRELRRAS
jgi:hypothetical protein